MADYSIRNIINKIQSGEIRIPSFQRDYVWGYDDVAFLIDSLYKGFPIGSVLFWRTNERLHTEKQLGNYILPEPQKNYPIDYVLDGQQRLTSLFSIFQTELSPEYTNDMGIYFIIDELDTIQKSRFVPLTKEDADPKKYFPISVLFDSVLYRKATELYDDNIKIKLDKLQETFKEIKIPYELLETDNKEHVAIVFERINRAGVPLNTFQLFNAWSWSEEFDLQDELNALGEELSEYGFNELVNQQDILVKCFTGLILESTVPKAIMDLNGNLIRNNYNKIRNGIKSSIDFLRKELNVYDLKNLPYPSMIIALTTFFATDKKNGKTFDDKQRAELVKWFWKSCFSRRYTSGVNDVQETDIKGMKELSKNSNYCITDFKCTISPSFFQENQFSAGAANTKTFILMLASKTPRSFISGAKVDLSKTLKMATSKEFHHIFPDKYLQRKNYAKKDIYCLSNFCFLNNADNQIIKDRAPSDYKSKICGDINEIMTSSLCPSNALDLPYEEFRSKITYLLLEYANSLI